MSDISIVINPAETISIGTAASYPPHASTHAPEAYDSLSSYYALTGDLTGYVGKNQTGYLSGVFYPYSSNPAGYVQGAVVRPSNTGNFVDKASTGYLTGAFYPLNENPAGYLTSIPPPPPGEQYLTYDEGTGYFYPLNANPSGYVTGSVVRPSETGSFVVTGQTGNFITSSQTGQFYPVSNPSGYVTGSVVRPSETGVFVTTGSTGNFVTGSVVRPSETGLFITTSQTGSFITTSQTGEFVSTGATGVFVTTGQTGQFYPTSNPSGYVTGSVVRPSETGIFLTSSQTGAFLTTGAADNRYALQSATGNFVTTAQTGNFIVSSQTGAFLTTGAADNLYYGLSNGQSISGYAITGFDDSITGITVTGVDTKTISLFRRGNTTLTVNFTDNAGSGSSDTGYLTGYVSKTETGAFLTTGAADGRYALQSATGAFVVTGQTGAFAAAAQTGAFLTTGAADGRYYGIVSTGEIYIDAGAMLTGISGATPTGIAFVNSGLSSDAYNFDAATNQYSLFKMAIPDNWNKGTIKSKFYWTASGGNGNVVWGMQAAAFSDDDPIDGSWGTAQEVTDSFITGNDLHISAATSAMTISNSPASNDLIMFRTYRNAAATGDTYSLGANLLGVKIQYTISGSITSW